ncbi:hypothetical protein [uncultured Abyssibacter sp.]|uniref:hypothetical protein n=1 Tax=uncultured Abyssibacter sp. TaxID=2320202 RepID=UPI0032B1A63C
MKERLTIALAAGLLSLSFGSTAQPKMPIELVDFGTDGVRADDDVCDDPRFVGPGMDGVFTDEADKLRDASDCKAAYAAGTIWIPLAEAPEDETTFENPLDW